MRNILFIILLTYSYCTSATTIYKCEVGDSTVFSQTPCDDNNTQIHVDETQSYQSNNPLPTGNNSNSSTNTQNYLVDKKINRTSRKIESLTIKMNKELKLLETKSLYASNNRAGAIYKQALSNEMLTTSNKYKALINVEQNKLKILQAKLTN